MSINRINRSDQVNTPKVSEEARAESAAFAGIKFPKRKKEPEKGPDGVLDLAPHEFSTDTERDVRQEAGQMSGVDVIGRHLSNFETAPFTKRYSFPR